MQKNTNPLFKSQKSIAPTNINNIDSKVFPWKVLIIDDEPEVHNVTKMVLRNFTLNGRGIQLFDAYSAQEAKGILDKEDDFSLCLIDVVMETDEAGLNLVKYIRNDLKNTKVRLVLRTGQPGYAPEKDIIRDYDINDYKDKTELTNTKLHTLMCSAFRAYDDIMSLERNRIGLEKVIEASAKIFETGSLQHFTSAVLFQLMGLLNLSDNAVMVQASGFSATSDKGDFQILAGVGEFQHLINNNNEETLLPEVKLLLEKAISKKSHIYENDRFVLYSETQHASYHLLYLKHHRELTPLDKRLIELFCTNVSIAYENQTLRYEIEETQQEIVCILGEAVENRSRESGNHIYRVAEMMSILAKAYGYSEKEAERIKAASPMHDVGKVGIPDNILHKPGKLDESEWKTMQLHVDMGYDMLKHSKRKILQYAAIIAHEHHERWDGGGYPQGLAGNKIHILGRIAAVVDVFDALTSKRCYKNAWPISDAIDYLQEQSGKQFDPAVVALFLENRSDIENICERYGDSEQDQSLH